jgi:hypothetical protein
VRLALPGALLAVALLASACSSSDPVGPLGTAGESGTECAPAGRPVVVGIWPMHETGHERVQIASAILPRQRHLHVFGIWLIPLGNLGGIGDAYYPQVDYPTWYQRRPAVHGVVDTGRGDALVFGVELTKGSSVGSAGGPVITYTAGGNTYTVHEAITVQLGRC